MTLLVIALMAGTAQEPAYIPAFFTGERLLRICSEPNAGQCSMYVAGALDGIFHAEAGDPDKGIWGGADMSNQEAAEIVTRFLRDHPAMRGKAAAVAVEQVLQERLKCPDNEGGTLAGAR